MKLFSTFLVGILSQDDVNDRLDALEDQVDYNTRELVLLRSRVNDVESRLVNNINKVEDELEPTVESHSSAIDSLTDSIESLEEILSCSGKAELDVCGCPFGFTYYQDDCVPSDEKAAKNWIDDFNVDYQIHVHDYTVAYFEYETNITDHNLEQANIESVKFGLWYASRVPYAIDVFDWRQFQDERLRRQFMKLLNNGESLSAEDNAALSGAQTKMSQTYATGQVGDADRCLRLEAGGTGEESLEGIMANSEDYMERLWAWLGWRTNVGDVIRPDFEVYIEMKNKWAVANGFDDYGQYWRSNYEMPDDNFNDLALAEFEKLKPLYQELHAFVRYKMSESFDDVIDNDGGLLPANLLGDMWGRFWTGINDFVIPYPDAPSVDVTPELIAQGYDAVKMFELSDDFFASLGEDNMYRMNDGFWENSVIERRPGTEMICHPTAWDLGNGEDFRIKMCTEINMDYLLTIHHEMGHIEYDMQYAFQPPQFRDGANEGFHEAMGEVMAMNVATPEHLEAIGLLPEFFERDLNTEEQTTINFLLFQSLQQVATMPFTIAMENWRYGVFNGTFAQDEWMEKFWEMKNEWVGVKAPAERTEKSCDPAALYHIANDYSMMRYYSRTIFQFQFQKVLCDACGHEGPLYTCDIYQCEEAGKRLSTLMKQGSESYWLDQLIDFTGDEAVTMNADGMVDYYSPLYEWLKAENIKNGINSGWNKEKNEFHPFEEMDFVGKCSETRNDRTTPAPILDHQFKHLLKIRPE